MEQAKIIRFLIRKTTFFRNLNFILDATDEAIEKSRKYNNDETIPIR